MSLSIEKMASSLNNMWKVEKNYAPTCLSVHDAKVFKDCMEAYTKKIVMLEADKDVIGSAEALSEMLLMVYSYVHRKGLYKVLNATCDICYTDIKRGRIVNDLEDEQDDFLFITEGQHKKTKIESGESSYKDIEVLFEKFNKRRKEDIERKAFVRSKEYKQKKETLL